MLYVRWIRGVEEIIEVIQKHLFHILYFFMPAFLIIFNSKNPIVPQKNLVFLSPSFSYIFLDLCFHMTSFLRYSLASSFLYESIASVSSVVLTSIRYCSSSKSLYFILKFICPKTFLFHLVKRFPQCSTISTNSNRLEILSIF